MCCVQVLNDVEEGLGSAVDITRAVDIIIREKAIKDVYQVEFREQLNLCLVRVSGVRALWVSVEAIRAERYCQDDEAHEALLMKV